MIYLDHNATSPSTPEHLEQLFSKLNLCSGNPSSPHAIGRNASVALTQARHSVAQALQIDSSQLIFVSGATEANNLATIGVLRYYGVSKSHAITSGLEHPSILEPLIALQSDEELNLSIVNPNQEGFVSLEELISKIQPNTNLISLMAANNEIGTIQPIQILGDFLHYKRWGVTSPNHQNTILELEKSLSNEITKEHLQNMHFHVDAVQIFGRLPVQKWFSSGIDSCSVSGHKLGALQGVGALFLRRGRKFKPLMTGGAQEKNRRAGTENIPGIISFGLICEKINEQIWWDKISEMENLRNILFQTLIQFPQLIFNSPSVNIIPNTLNFSILQKNKSQLNGEDILLNLDLAGICASSGSACSSGANLPSKIILSLGKTPEIAKNAIRMSLSPKTTQQEINFVCEFFQKLFAQ